MMRVLAFVLLASGAFAATLWLRGTGPTGRPPGEPAASGEDPTARLPSPAANTRQTGDRERLTRTNPPRAPRMVTIGSPKRSAFQEARERSPREASLLRNALYERAMAESAERGVGIRDCLAEADVPEAQRLRFTVQVESEEQRMRAEAWQFVEIIEGTQLAPDTIECMEEALGGPYEIEAAPGEEFLPGFRGEIQLVWRGP